MNKTRQPWMALVAPGITIIVGLAMLAVSWRKWPDPLVDFGRELYVPWQLSQGEVLYRDIAYFNGPLSPYFNALIFKTFGVSLMSLVWANIAILAVLVFLVYRLLSFIGSRFAATMACVTFLVIFALAQYTNTGNYNFICPYSHELTHGVLLSLAAVYLLSRYLAKPRAIFLGLTGLCLGLILLTKVEVFLAAAVALLVGLLLIFRQEKPPAARLFKLLLFFTVGLLVPFICFALYLMPCRRALQSIFFSYAVVLKGDLSGQRFYLSGLGLDNPGDNLLRIAVVSVWYVVLLGPLVLADWLLRRFDNKRRRYLCLLVFLAGLVIGSLFFHRAAWLDCLRPLPLFMLIAGAGLLIGLLRPRDSARLLIALVLTVFSLLLLSKMILNVHAYQYGFALAAPATMLLIVVLLDWLPGLITDSSSGGWVFKTAMSAILIVALAWHFDFSRKDFAKSTQQIGRGSDAFLVSPWPKGQAVSEALQNIIEHIPPGKTFVVFPEGVMLNYLSRRPNPTGYFSFMPPELIMFGQDNILDALRQHPPDYVVRVPRGLDEYGHSSFAQCAPGLVDWIETSYGPEEIIGQSRWQTSDGVYVYAVHLRKRISQ